jgi:Tol biopolymer transport system component
MKLRLALLLLLAMSACSLGSTATTTPPAPPADTPAGVATTVTLPSGAGVLPAPLLFLSNRGGSDQIWRLDVDAVTLTQLTNEPAPVTRFDVSAADGRIAYVSNNDLLIANADGSGRTLLVNGPEAPSPLPDNWQITSEVGPLFWSPDGSRIVFGLNGVNLISVAGGPSTLLIASDAVPQPPDFAQPAGGARFYWPDQWSPDGQRLMVSFAYWPEAGGVAVTSASGGPRVELQSPAGIVCCNPTWSLDGNSIYYASSSVGLISAGLWRADANTGQSTTLIQGELNDAYTLVGYAQQAGNGRLYYFLSRANGFPEGFIALTMYSSDADGVSNQAQLRNDAHIFFEALWAHDGSGAVIVDSTEAVNSGSFSTSGPLLYLKSDGSAAIPLIDNAYALRWGR